MAKEPRKEMNGKEARYILKSNNVNIAWLSEQLGITPQSMNSRLNSAVFKKAYQMEINSICERRIFDVQMSDVIVEVKGRIPVIDMRVSAGFGVALMEGNENRVTEYVTMEGLNGCVGVYVYGDSMSPEYRPGDIVFVRQITNVQELDYGRPYVIITREERVLKCIYESKHDDEHLRLTSFNDETNRNGDRLFPDRDIRKDSILFVYKVIGMFRREQL